MSCIVPITWTTFGPDQAPVTIGRADDADAAARARDVLVGLYNRLDQGQDVDAAAVEAVIGMANQPALDGIIDNEVASLSSSIVMEDVLFFGCSPI